MVLPGRTVSGRYGSTAGDSRSRAGDHILAHSHRQPVVRSRGYGRDVHRTSRPVHAVGLRQEDGVPRCGIARVNGLERSDGPSGAHEPGAHRGGTQRAERGVAAGSVRQSPAGDRYQGAARDVFPGSWSAGPPRGRHACKGLYLAGDWIDTGLPATIESAVRSGHGAALAALSNLR